MEQVVVQQEDDLTYPLVAERYMSAELLRTNAGGRAEHMIFATKRDVVQGPTMRSWDTTIYSHSSRLLFKRAVADCDGGG
jgi:hypothetical protein